MNFKSLIIFLTISNIANASNIVSFKTDVWCPYACDPNAKNPGYVIEVLKEVFQKKGLTIKYENASWGKSIKEVKEGVTDGVIGGGKKEFEGLIIHNESIGFNSNYFWTNASSKFNYDSPESLNIVKSDLIGIIANYSYSEEIDFLIKKNASVFHVVSDEKPLNKMINLLLSNKIGALIENENVFKYTVLNQNISPQRFKLASHQLNLDTGLFIGFSPKNPNSKAYATILDEGLIKLRKTGKLKKILSKYGLSDWK